MSLSLHGLAGLALSIAVVATVVTAQGKNAARRQKRETATATTSATTPNNAPTDCPVFVAVPGANRISNDKLIETSGLAASRKSPGVLFGHNDSGGEPQIYAFTTTGKDLGTYTLAGAKLTDWEDLALGPGPDASKSYLYVGDIGDNDSTRKFVSVYRTEEPKVDPQQPPKRYGPLAVKRFDLTYPDRAAHDAEALMVDPLTTDLYLITKVRGGVPLVFRAKAPLSTSSRNELELVIALNKIEQGSVFSTLVTSADISQDGRLVLIRTYFSAFLFRREGGESIEACLSRPPCRVPLQIEPQGESIAFLLGDLGYVTTSEGKHPALHIFTRK